jgi:hypothetical protein
MRGNEIIVTSEPMGMRDEGFVKTGETLYPGMIVQRDPTVALQGGRHTYKIYNRDADGDHPAGAWWVVTNELLAMVGKTCSDSYAAGERVSVYCPRPGEELNLLVENLSGTADDHTAGEILMVNDGTGKLIATTGSPETEVAQLQETITDPTADTLAFCGWSGSA